MSRKTVKKVEKKVVYFCIRCGKLSIDSSKADIKSCSNCNGENTTVIRNDLTVRSR